MANGYSGVLGQTYEIGRRQQPVASGIDPYMLQQMQAIQGGQPPKLDDPLEGVYEVEGLTKDYFNKWASLNTFASDMFNKGINVTKPDPLNPESQAAFQWYQKAVADLKRHGNLLKNAQTNAQEYMKARLSSNGQNIGTVSGFNPNKQILTPFDVVNTGETDLAKRVNADLAKSTNDPAERAALQSQIDSKAASLKQELADMLVSGADQAAIEQKAAEIRSLQDATYNDTDRWKERQQNWRSKLDKEEKPEDLTRVKLVQAVKGGDYTLLQQMPNVKTVKRSTTPRKDELIVTLKDGSKKTIDLMKGTDTGINEFINSLGEGSAVSVDDYTKKQKLYQEGGGVMSSPVPKDVSEAEKRFIGILQVGGKSKEFRAAQTILNNARPNLAVPATMSGGDSDSLAKEITYPSEGVIKIKLQGEKNKSYPDVIFDLTTEKDRRRFKEFIDFNSEYLDYESFTPEPQDPRFKDAWPPKVGGTEVAGNLSDLL